MRIVHYLESLRLEQDGMVRAVLDLATGLAGCGQIVTVITCDDADLASAWSAAGGAARPDVRRIAAPPLPGQPLPRSALRAVAEYCLRGADVLHLHGVWTPSNLQLAALARNAGIPYVVSTHGALDDWRIAQLEPKKRLYLHFLGRRLLTGAAAVHMTATRELSQPAARLGGHDPVVIPPAVDLRAFATLPDGTPPTGRVSTVLFSGGLDRAKGVELLLDATALLATADWPLQLLIAGVGAPRYQRSLRVRARRLRLGDRVEFLGFVPEASRATLYRSADVFACPSWHDAAGFPLFEALAAGTPVVTTRGTATWPQLSASGGAVLVEPSAEDVAAGITTALKDAERLGGNGRAWALAHLEPARGAVPYVQLYEQLHRAARDAAAVAPTVGDGTAGNGATFSSEPEGHTSLRRMAKWPAKRRGKLSS